MKTFLDSKNQSNQCGHFVKLKLFFPIKDCLERKLLEKGECLKQTVLESEDIHVL